MNALVEQPQSQLPAVTRSQKRKGASDSSRKRKGPPGRLDVLIDDETYEAGSGNIIVVTLKNPFEVAVEILDLAQPLSSSLRRLRQKTESNTSEQTRPIRKFLQSVLPYLGNGITASIGFGGIKAQFGRPRSERKCGKLNWTSAQF